MAQYGISVREILKRTVIVEAENLEAAIQKVEEAVEREEIILDVDDYDEREIIPSEYFEGGKVPDGKDVSFYCKLRLGDRISCMT
ncbi:DpnD/PcfM family protein [Romboutsia ilealis]|uniref:DpnD/PcfM family protein n=1 Tax=Romboutsia ilealis TaxID=1115758 RepID=UPI0026F3A684|nr:DpnD/PcfM family protein [Romboutsia ilealis]